MYARSLFSVAILLASLAAATDWRELFDGKTLSGWRGLGRSDVPAGHWAVEDGAIRKIETGSVALIADGQPVEGGDIISLATFEHFELSFEWKVAPGANSGIKYNVSERMSTEAAPETAALGFEYQVLDDERHPDALNGPNRTAGALYDLIEPNESKHLRPVGQFNSGRIVLRGSHGEHWLNGEKVIEFDLSSEDFRKRLEKSKYAPVAGFADRRVGHIVLQDHTDDVWFRNVRIRELEEK